VTYAYDELGERTKTTPEKGGATTYGYDQAGNLTSVERPEKESVPKIEDSYAYNGSISRSSPSQPPCRLRPRKAKAVTVVRA